MLAPTKKIGSSYQCMIPIEFISLLVKYLIVICDSWIFSANLHAEGGKIHNSSSWKL